MLYNSLVLPHLNYAQVIWGSNYETTLEPLFIQQKRAVRLIYDVPPGTHTSPLFRELKILKLKDQLHYQLLLLLHDFLSGRLPPVIAEKFALVNYERPLRMHSHFSEVIYNSSGAPAPNYRYLNTRLFTVFASGPRAWNKIITPKIPNLGDIPMSKNQFKKCLKLLFTDHY